MSMKTHLRHIILIGLLFASLVGSSGAWAVDCPLNDYDLDTQAKVDAFPQNCDSVLGALSVGTPRGLVIPMAPTTSKTSTP